MVPKDFDQEATVSKNLVSHYLLATEPLGQNRQCSPVKNCYFIQNPDENSKNTSFHHKLLRPSEQRDLVRTHDLEPILTRVSLCIGPVLLLTRVKFSTNSFTHLQSERLLQERQGDFNRQLE